MLILIGIGFLGGLVIGISPCIVPVVPVVLAGGAVTKDRRRPYWIIAGLVASFSIFTLVGGSVLSALHLPQDFLRSLGIAMLVVLAFGLIIPSVGDLLERPFSRLGGRPQATSGSGFLLGASLGLVFVPCAGPVLAAISVVAATHHVGASTAVLTVSYAIGVAIPLLILAVVAERSVETFGSLRERTPMLRRIAGVILGLTAIAIAFNLTAPLQRDTPGYTTSLENSIGGSGSGANALRSLTGENVTRFDASPGVAFLTNDGPAPNFTGITSWLNTPGDRPLTLNGLRGKVVLVDFWTYSCINCQRSLPHVEAWYRLYHKDGFVVVGVHAPEFPFEHVRSNVIAAAAQLGVHYPIAMDNNFATWDAYGNQYWPAEYLIDQRGDVRHTQFGEGDYANTEAAIRALLRKGGATHLPQPSDLPDLTPTEQMTQESYLGYSRLNNEVGTEVLPDESQIYQAPSKVPASSLAFSGRWNVHAQDAAASSGSQVILNFTAKDVYLVLGGHGTLQVALNGQTIRTISVHGIPSLVTLVQAPSSLTGTLTLTFSSGLDAYDFTFG